MNSGVSGGLAAILVAAILAAGQQDDVLTRARELAKAGRSAEAEQALAEAVRAGMDTAEVHGALGSLLFQRRDFRNAIPQLGRAVQLAPDAAEYNMDLAGALIGDGRYRVALKFLAAVEPRFGKLAAHQYNVGLAHFGLREYGSASVAFRRVLKIAPNMDAAHFFLGSILVLNGDLARGAAAYRRALRLNPRNANYTFALGKVLGRTGPQFEQEAISQLRKALELQPGHAPSTYELGRICERAGDLACARPLLESIVARYPDLLAAHYALARIYSKLDMPEAAARETEHVRRLRAAPQNAVRHEIEVPLGVLPVPTTGIDQPERTPPE